MDSAKDDANQTLHAITCFMFVITEITGITCLSRWAVVVIHISDNSRVDFNPHRANNFVGVTFHADVISNNSSCLTAKGKVFFEV